MAAGGGGGGLPSWNGTGGGNQTNMGNVTLFKFLSVKEDGSPFTSAQDMADYVSQEHSKSDKEDFVVAALQFDKVLGPEIEYRFRFPHSSAPNGRSWNTNRVYPGYLFNGPRKNSFDSYFLNLQYLIDTSIIQLKTGWTANFVSGFKAPPLAVGKMQQFPYPSFQEDGFVGFIRGLMPLVFVIAFVYTAASIVKELVAEKQFRLKESMKMMGLANWMHWTAWFIKFFLFFCLTAIILTALIKGGKIFTYTDAGVTFIFLIFYLINLTSFHFFLSVLFSKTVLAQLAAAFLMFGTWIPYSYLASQNGDRLDAMSKASKFLLCLLPNSNMGVTLTVISKWEAQALKLDWSAASKVPTLEDNFTLNNCLLMYLISTLVYFLLTWYIEAVFPGQYGVPRPPWFLFTPSYWCGARTGSPPNFTNPNSVHPASEDFEEEPPDMEIGVAINDLRKTLKGATGKKTAVDGLSLKMYKGQITSLLGHNGAGKTTTMSILTGLFPPSGGSATISGHDILTEMDSIRDSLGLCPQHNIRSTTFSLTDSLLGNIWSSFAL
jgi:hypothetical protein